MASFVENLWNSIFTPGPTSTLLVATNATFAALQLLLAGLLVTTYSIHFAILSFLCGGLWYAINWFAKEVKDIQEREEENKRRLASQHDHAGDADGTSMDSGDDTETELDQSRRSVSGSATTSPKAQASPNATAGPQSSGLAPPGSNSDAVRQRRSLADSSGDISTDSEWEKVEGE